MPYDEKNENCKRRRKLLSQLNRIVDTINRKKPRKRNKPLSSPPINICRDVPLQRESFQRHIPVKETKSMLIRGSILYKCQCIRRNGLQDQCMMNECMGKPECMAKFYPLCAPGQKALAKFMNHGNVEAALEKLIAADKARESALANYCKLVGSKGNNDSIERSPPLSIISKSSLSTLPSTKSSIMQLKYQRINNHQQNPKLQQLYSSMQGAQQLRQESIYQQPMNYSNAQEHQHQFHPQNYRYPTSFINNQPTYPPHQEYPGNQQYQFQIPTQFVQQYPHPPP